METGLVSNNHKGLQSKLRPHYYKSAQPPTLRSTTFWWTIFKHCIYLLVEALIGSFLCGIFVYVISWIPTQYTHPKHGDDYFNIWGFATSILVALLLLNVFWPSTCLHALFQPDRSTTTKAFGWIVLPSIVINIAFVYGFTGVDKGRTFNFYKLAVIPGIQLLWFECEDKQQQQQQLNRSASIQFLWLK